jgi:N-acylneuraminate cytidylyltransferase
MKKLKNIAIIPARGGSKRIPHKNIKEFLGKPIIAYSIEVALKSQLFDEVMVSTDDIEIAEISKKYGASVPFTRSNENANDFAILNDVYIEVISKYKRLNIEFDHACIILPTAPMVSVENLKKSYILMSKSNFDSVRPIVKFSYPIQRAFKRNDAGKVEMMQPKYYKSRSQDLEPAYHDSGQFYWINKDKNLLDTNKGAIIISEIAVQDIDTEEDWELAELKYKLMIND